MICCVHSIEGWRGVIHRVSRPWFITPQRNSRAPSERTRDAHAARAKPARDTKAPQMSRSIDLRPPWPGNYTARPSVCASVSGWSTHDAYPQRSPLATIDYLARHVAGRSFCELGSRHGDISACLKPHARGVTVLEYQASYCDAIRRRGLEVVCESIYKVAEANPFRFPIADVYFFWVPHLAVERWLKLLLNASRSFPHAATAFVQLDSTNELEAPHVARLARRYHAAEVAPIFHEEGNRGLRLAGDQCTPRPGPAWPSASDRGRASKVGGCTTTRGLMHILRFELKGRSSHAPNRCISR